VPSGDRLKLSHLGRRWQRVVWQKKRKEKKQIGCLLSICGAKKFPASLPVLVKSGSS